MATGLSPEWLESCDATTLATLTDVVIERERASSWTNTEAVLADIYDLLSAMRIEQLLVAGVKPADVPQTSRYPRPGDSAPEAPKTGPRKVSLSEFAAMMRR